MKQQPIALLLASVLGISSAQAADTVRWEDLPKKIGHSNDRSTDREYTVITKDGRTKKGTALAVTAKGVQFSDSSPVILREEIAEIKIHHHLRMSDAASAPAARAFRDVDEGWLIFFWALLPAMVVTYGATAPPAMAVEAVRRMLRDKVIKVAP